MIGGEAGAGKIIASANLRLVIGSVDKAQLARVPKYIFAKV